MTLSIAILFTSVAQCSQIEEGSTLGRTLQDHACVAVTGRVLAEGDAWWQFQFNKGPVPEYSQNQLGQNNIRHPNTPIADRDYDNLFVPATLATLSPHPVHALIIHGPKQEDRTYWINTQDFPAALRYAPGSKQNPINIDN